MELRGFDDSPQKESAPTKKQQPPQKQDGGTGTKARPEQKDGQFLTIFFCSGWKPTHLTSVLSPPDGPTLTAFADVNTDVLRENTDVRWVGFLSPSFLGEDKLSQGSLTEGERSVQLTSMF